MADMEDEADDFLVSDADAHVEADGLVGGATSSSGSESDSESESDTRPQSGKGRLRKKGHVVESSSDDDDDDWSSAPSSSESEHDPSPTINRGARDPMAPRFTPTMVRRGGFIGRKKARSRRRAETLAARWTTDRAAERAADSSATAAAAGGGGRAKDDSNDDDDDDDEDQEAPLRARVAPTTSAVATTSVAVATESSSKDLMQWRRVLSRTEETAATSRPWWLDDAELARRVREKARLQGRTLTKGQEKVAMAKVKAEARARASAAAKAAKAAAKVATSTTKSKTKDDGASSPLVAWDADFPRLWLEAVRLVHETPLVGYPDKLISNTNGASVFDWVLKNEFFVNMDDFLRLERFSRAAEVMQQWQSRARELRVSEVVDDDDDDDDDDNDDDRGAGGPRLVTPTTVRECLAQFVLGAQSVDDAMDAANLLRVFTVKTGPPEPDDSVADWAPSDEPLRAPSTWSKAAWHELEQRRLAARDWIVRALAELKRLDDSVFWEGTITEDAALVEGMRPFPGGTSAYAALRQSVAGLVDAAAVTADRARTVRTVAEFKTEIVGPWVDACASVRHHVMDGSLKLLDQWAKKQVGRVETFRSRTREGKVAWLHVAKDMIQAVSRALDLVSGSSSGAPNKPRPIERQALRVDRVAFLAYAAVVLYRFFVRRLWAQNALFLWAADEAQASAIASQESLERRWLMDEDGFDSKHKHTFVFGVGWPSMESMLKKRSSNDALVRAWQLVRNRTSATSREPVFDFHVVSVEAVAKRMAAALEDLRDRKRQTVLGNDTEDSRFPIMTSTRGFKRRGRDTAVTGLLRLWFRARFAIMVDVERRLRRLELLESKETVVAKRSEADRASAIEAFLSAVKESSVGDQWILEFGDVTAPFVADLSEARRRELRARYPAIVSPHRLPAVAVANKRSKDDEEEYHTESDSDEEWTDESIESRWDSFVRSTGTRVKKMENKGGWGADGLRAMKNLARRRLVLGRQIQAARQLGHLRLGPCLLVAHDDDDDDDDRVLDYGSAVVANDDRARLEGGATDDDDDDDDDSDSYRDREIGLPWHTRVQGIWNALTSAVVASMQTEVNVFIEALKWLGFDATTHPKLRDAHARLLAWFGALAKPDRAFPAQAGPEYLRTYRHTAFLVGILLCKLAERPTSDASARAAPFSWFSVRLKDSPLPPNFEFATVLAPLLEFALQMKAVLSDLLTTIDEAFAGDGPTSEALRDLCGVSRAAAQKALDQSGPWRTAKVLTLNAGDRYEFDVGTVLRRLVQQCTRQGRFLLLVLRRIVKTPAERARAWRDVVEKALSRDTARGLVRLAVADRVLQWDAFTSFAASPSKLDEKFAQETMAEDLDGLLYDARTETAAAADAAAAAAAQGGPHQLHAWFAQHASVEVERIRDVWWRLVKHPTRAYRTKFDLRFDIRSPSHEWRVKVGMDAVSMQCLACRVAFALVADPQRGARRRKADEANIRALEELCASREWRRLGGAATVAEFMRTESPAWFRSGRFRKLYESMVAWFRRNDDDDDDDDDDVHDVEDGADGESLWFDRGSERLDLGEGAHWPPRSVAEVRAQCVRFLAMAGAEEGPADDAIRGLRALSGAGGNDDDDDDEALDALCDAIESPIVERLREDADESSADATEAALAGPPRTGSDVTDALRRRYSSGGSADPFAPDFDAWLRSVGTAREAVAKLCYTVLVCALRGKEPHGGPEASREASLAVARDIVDAIVRPNEGE